MNPTESASIKHSGSMFGTLLLRVIVPCWVLAGAGVKLYTRNAKLLPEPVLEVIRESGQLLNVESLSAWLGFSLRSLIGIEIALAMVMIFSPRLAKAAAGFTLGVFLAVLAATMAMAASREGLSAVWSGSCGCFGSASPPPIVMFAIDAALLLGIIFFKPITEHPRGKSWPLVIGGLCLGLGLAFGIPDRVITLEPTVTDASGNTTSTVGFGEVPTTLDPNYFTTFSEWTGTPLASHPLAQLISRPLPDWIESDRFHLIFYRADCEHCHELMETFFAGPLTTPTIAVQIPDHEPGSELEMTCDECLLHSLPEGPNYIISSPVLMTVEGGQVLAVCEDSDDHTAVMDTIEATASPASEQSQATTDTTSSSADAWGDMPTTLEPYYFPEFEDWNGTPLASHPLAKLLPRPIPEWLRSGRGFVIFYRADCEHCHDLISQWFTQSLPGPTLAIEIPDTDPAGAMEFPSTLVTRGSVPKGPDYVMSTPAMLTIVDGVVRCYASDPEDVAQIETCLSTK